MANSIFFRKGTAAHWAASNPVLRDGEPGWEKDTGKLKVGDGVTTWNDLEYFSSSSEGGGILQLTNPIMLLTDLIVPIPILSNTVI